MLIHGEFFDGGNILSSNTSAIIKIVMLSLAKHSKKLPISFFTVNAAQPFH
jgi:hypothetical protein